MLPPPAEKLQNFFGVFLQFQIGVDKNTGKVDGAEVAQLYVSKLSAQVFRPAKELKGFQKVFLRAGESKTVTIPLDDKAFRYFDVRTSKFEVEGGEYQILIGASVADIRLSGSVTIAGNACQRYWHATGSNCCPGTEDGKTVVCQKGCLC